MSDGANIVELFSSIQGEGAYAGYRQIFVRFFSCNLECVYCDTPRSLKDVRSCLIERTPGKGDFYKLPNPLDVKTLNDIISSFETVTGLNHSISLTGGEPLLQSRFLGIWLPQLKRDFKIYLETNGTLYEELKDIIDYVDIISMDIKLPGAASIEPQWERHRKFLSVARQKELFIKLVVVAHTSDDEFMEAVDFLAEEDADVPLVIQPVTPCAGVKDKVGAGRLLDLHAMASSRLNNVRLIPQTHKMMELL
ncbi:MAG: 7-carboxy-7-deazaguanine synthase QueE [bacterium]|nr:7-carboxy-7-deazaguanine synthase QueE [bacterium]